MSGLKPVWVLVLLVCVCVCVGNKVFIASAVTVTEPSLRPHVVLLYFLRLPPWGGAAACIY